MSNPTLADIGGLGASAQAQIRRAVLHDQKRHAIALHFAPATSATVAAENATAGDIDLFQTACMDAGLSCPRKEFRFHSSRRWRFDYAWPVARVALEIQGGIFSRGRHVRGAAMLKEWEKLNMAAALGWRVLFCQPKDATCAQTIWFLNAAVNYKTGEAK